MFTDPNSKSSSTPNMHNWTRAYDTVHLLWKGSEPSSEHSHTETDISIPVIKSNLLRTPDELYLAWLLAALVPWAGAPPPQSPTPSNKQPSSVPSTVAREGLKVSNKVLDIIAKAFKNANEIDALRRRVVMQRSSSDPPPAINEKVGRSDLGLAIRRWGSSWRSQVLLALLLDVVHQPQHEFIEGKFLCAQRTSSTSFVLTVKERNAVLGDYAVFLKHLNDLDLVEAYLFKPVLNGKQLSQALQVKPGPWMTEALEMVMVWQLENPGVTNLDGAVAEVLKNRGRLGL